MNLLIQRLSKSATVPKRASSGAAGYDLSSAETTTVPPRTRKLVATDLSFRLPAGVYGRIAPRSGLAMKKCIDIGAGVIDPDYRGNVFILIINQSDQEFIIQTGDRIAQLILENFSTAEMKEVSSLDDTDRGAGGFGSTGKAKETVHPAKLAFSGKWNKSEFFSKPSPGENSSS